MRELFCLFFILLSLDTFPASQRSCSNLLSKFLKEPNHIVFEEENIKLFGSNLKYSKISSSQLKNGKLFASKLESEDSIFIGFGLDGHVYMTVGKKRYDGDLFYRSPSLRKQDTLSEGIVLKIKYQDNQIPQKITEYLEEGKIPRSLTCVQGVCNVLDDDEISAILPHKLFKKIIQQSRQSSNGKQIEVFNLGDQNFQDTYSSIFTNSTSIRLNLSFATIMSLYLIYILNDSTNEAPPL